MVGRLADDANGTRTNTVDDQRGRGTRSIDALGNVTQFIYDAVNRWMGRGYFLSINMSIMISIASIR
jgi:hypothetical protein